MNFEVEGHSDMIAGCRCPSDLTSDPTRAPSAPMTALLEFSPLIAFAIAYYVGGLYAATGALMIAMPIALLIGWKMKGKLPTVHAVSTALVLVFGAATLMLRNAQFIQWKPSVFLWLVGVAFLVSAFVGKQTLTQRMLQPALGDAQRNRADWLKANVASVIFCFLLGAVNLLLAYRVSELAWVRFKLLGLPAAMFVALLLQLWWLNTRRPAAT